MVGEVAVVVVRGTGTGWRGEGAVAGRLVDGGVEAGEGGEVEVGVWTTAGGGGCFGGESGGGGWWW